MAKKVLLTLSQFILLGETQSKILAAQGYEIVIVDNVPTATAVDNQPKVAVQPKVENASNNVRKSTKNAAKADSKKSSAAKADKKPAVAYGKVKVNDLIKVVNISNGKIVAVGKAKEVSKADDMLTTTSGKKFKLANCVAINKATYAKLKKSLKSSEAKSNSNRLTPTDYKVVYVAYLAKQGKITADQVAKAKDSAEYRADLYHQFSKELPLTNAEALKLFAEMSDKKTDTAPANAETTDNANANA